MSENLRKLIGVAVMAAIVVVGVVATSGDDSDFDRTRNVAFGLPKGAGLGAQVQQPGDAENELVIAMAAAAQCGEGYVLVSTGDPVSPWRCGIPLAEVATIEIVENTPVADAHRSNYRPCNFLYQVFEFDPSGEVLEFDARRRTEALKSCLQDWSVGRSVEEVELAMRMWWETNVSFVCNRLISSGEPIIRQGSQLVVGITFRDNGSCF
ncbi:MAG: hypothetical protein VX734_08605 [Actinomycetota bacterium]|nr:hypothetical protein [Actinomycetota bacterium]